MTEFIKPNKVPFILGVAGGSGSGKTYFSKALQKVLGPEKCVILSQDHFYHDQSAKFDKDGGAVNFDHPDAIDAQLISQCLIKLKAGQEIEIPYYDFATHKRLPSRQTLKPTPLIIVDGILVLHYAQVRAHFSESIFFDTSEALRFERRLLRDVKERGRTEEGVRVQFFKQVKPMHDEFVEPSKTFATQLVKNEADFEKVLERYSKLFQ